MLIVSGGYAVNQMTLIGQEVEEISQINMPLVMAINEIETHQLEQARYLGKAERLALQAVATPSLFKEFEAAVERIHFFSEAVDEELIAAEDKARTDIVIARFEQDREEFRRVLAALERIEIEHTEYEQHVFELLEILASLGEGEQDTAHQQALELKIDQEELQLDEEIEELLGEIEQYTQNSLRLAEEHEKAGLRGLIQVLIVAIFVSVVTSFIISRKITGPLGEISRVTQRIAEGDLSPKLERKGSDEVGDVADAMKALLQTLNTMAVQADAIAAGDFSVDIVPRNDRDTLAVALLAMKQQIIERNQFLQRSEAQ